MCKRRCAEEDAKHQVDTLLHHHVIMIVEVVSTIGGNVVIICVIVEFWKLWCQSEGGRDRQGVFCKRFSYFCNMKVCTEAVDPVIGVSHH